MLYQFDNDNALVVGYLDREPTKTHDKNGERMVVIEVVYDKMHHRNPTGARRSRLLRLPVIIFGEYSSYASTLVKGDCVLCVGHRPLEPPKGYDANPMLVGKYYFGFVGGTGITRAFREEVDTYTKNKVTRAINVARENQKKRSDEDKFGEIRGDWY